jgi:hypothetical protein
MGACRWANPGRRRRAGGRIGQNDDLEPRKIRGFAACRWSFRARREGKLGLQMESFAGNSAKLDLQIEIPQAVLGRSPLADRVGRAAHLAGGVLGRRLGDWDILSVLGFLLIARKLGFFFLRRARFERLSILGYLMGHFASEPGVACGTCRAGSCNLYSWRRSTVCARSVELVPQDCHRCL